VKELNFKTQLILPCWYIKQLYVTKLSWWIRSFSGYE